MTIGKIRLNRYIASCGVCARRKADELILAGKISVNGVVVKKLGEKVNPEEDTVLYNGKTLKEQSKLFLVMNKPKDVVCTVSDEKGRKTVLDMIPDTTKRLYPIGRLDKKTTGILVLTNDGDMARKLSHPSSNISKKYLVKIDGVISTKDVTKLKEGISLEDGISKCDAIEILPSQRYGDTIKLSLHSGKNRVIRRMFEALDLKVKWLDRVAFAGLSKKGLPRGKYRPLTNKEIGFLKVL